MAVRQVSTRLRSLLDVAQFPAPVAVAVAIVLAMAGFAEVFAVRSALLADDHADLVLVRTVELEHYLLDETVESRVVVGPRLAELEALVAGDPEESELVALIARERAHPARLRAIFSRLRAIEESRRAVLETASRREAIAGVVLVGGVLLFGTLVQALLASAFGELRLRRRLADERELLLRLVQDRSEWLDAVLAQTPAAIVVADARTGELVYRNRALLESATDDGGRARTLAEYAALGWQRLDGRRLAPEEHPLARALRGETTTLELRDPRRADGVFLVTAAPLRDRAGTTTGAIGTLLDVGERRRAIEALRASEHRERAKDKVGHR